MIILIISSSRRLTGVVRHQHRHVLGCRRKEEELKEGAYEHMIGWKNDNQRTKNKLNLLLSSQKKTQAWPSGIRKTQDRQVPCQFGSTTAERESRKSAIQGDCGEKRKANDQKQSQFFAIPTEEGTGMAIRHQGTTRADQYHINSDQHG